MKLIIEQQGMKYEFPLTTDEIVIGRSKECDITVNDQKVSSRHARITINNGVVTVQDLLSKNGTLVNGSKTEIAELSNGDVVSLGTTNIMLKSDEEAVDQAAVPTYQNFAQVVPQQDIPYSPNTATMTPQAPGDTHTNLTPTQTHIQPSQPQGPFVGPDGKQYILDPATGSYKEFQPQSNLPVQMVKPNVSSILKKYKKATIVTGICLFLIIVLSIMKATQKPIKVNPLPKPKYTSENYNNDVQSAIKIADDDIDEAITILQNADSKIPTRRIARKMTDLLNYFKTNKENNYATVNWEEGEDLAKDLIDYASRTNEGHPGAKTFGQNKLSWIQEQMSYEPYIAEFLSQLEKNNLEVAVMKFKQYIPHNSVYYKNYLNKYNQAIESLINSNYDTATSAQKNYKWNNAIDSWREYQKYVLDNEKQKAEKNIEYCEKNIEISKKIKEIQKAINDNDIVYAKNLIENIDDPGAYENELKAFADTIYVVMQYATAISEYDKGNAAHAINILNLLNNSNAYRQQVNKMTQVLDLYEDAKKAEKDGKPWEAIKKWNQILNLESNSNNFYYMDASEKLKEYDSENPESLAEKFTNMGIDAKLKKDYQYARICFDEALNEMPNYKRARENVDLLIAEANRTYSKITSYLFKDNITRSELIEFKSSVEKALLKVKPTEDVYVSLMELKAKIEKKLN